MASLSSAEARTKPQVLLLLPTDDYNGAFSTGTMRYFCAPLAKQARLKTIRILSESHFYSALKIFGEHCDSIVLAGHGTEKNVRFTKDFVIEDETQLRGKLPPKCKKLVLLSCLTGKSKLGIAARLAKLGVKVLAPKSCTTNHDSETNPLYHYGSGVFPINFTEGRVFFPDGGYRDCTGYERISTGDLPKLFCRKDCRDTAFRVHRLVRAGNLHCATILFTRLLRETPPDPKSYKFIYVRNKLHRLIQSLISRGKIEKAKALFCSPESTVTEDFRRVIVSRIRRAGRADVAKILEKEV